MTAVTLPGSMMEIVYFCPKWKDQQGGFLWDLTPSGFYNRRHYYGLSEIWTGRSPFTIALPIDPLTVISLGLATASELNIPPGLEAAFNLLK